MRMRSLLAVATLWLAFVLLTAGPAGAEELIDTIDYEDPFVPMWWDIGDAYGTDIAQADKFSFSGEHAYYLLSIELPVTRWALPSSVPPGDRVEVALWQGSSPEQGVLIESFSFTNQTYTTQTDGTIVMLSTMLSGESTSSPLLTPNTDYWLVVSAPGSGGLYWHVSSPAVSGPHMYGAYGSWISPTQQLMGAFRINGSLTPPSPGSIEVLIDIKPGSYPNSLNINGNGVIPVAVLGSESFDVTQIDRSTLLFAGLPVRVKGNGAPQCSISDVNGDGYNDLVCQFVDNVDDWLPGDAEATLAGNLLDTTPFAGTDTIRIVP